MKDRNIFLFIVVSFTAYNIVPRTQQSFNKWMSEWVNENILKPIKATHLHKVSLASQVS